MRLASYNFGLPKESFEARSFQGFNFRAPLNFEAAEKADGFVARAPNEDGNLVWGKEVFPRFIKGSGFASGLSQFSIWRDVESLMAFSYNGVHANALKHGRKWNRERQWPAIVLWWVRDDEAPQWADAVERFEHLHDNGPSAYAFDFKSAFSSDGQPLVIDREMVKTIAARNAAEQTRLLEAVEAMRV